MRPSRVPPKARKPPVSGPFSQPASASSQPPERPRPEIRTAPDLDQSRSGSGAALSAPTIDRGPRGLRSVRKVGAQRRATGVRDAVMPSGRFERTARLFLCVIVFGARERLETSTARNIGSPRHRQRETSPARDLDDARLDQLETRSARDSNSSRFGQRDSNSTTLRHPKTDDHHRPVVVIRSAPGGAPARRWRPSPWAGRPPASRPPPAPCRDGRRSPAPSGPPAATPHAS